MSVTPADLTDHKRRYSEGHHIDYITVWVAIDQRLDSRANSPNFWCPTHLTRGRSRGKRGLGATLKGGDTFPNVEKGCLFLLTLTDTSSPIWLSGGCPGSGVLVWPKVGGG